MRGGSLKLGKNGLARKVLPLLWVLFLVAGAAFFTGCDPDKEDKNLGFIPEGTWSSSWAGDTGTDVYKIEDETFTYTSTPKGGTSTCWSGTIEAAVDFVSKKSGVLIVKYTAPPSGDYAGVHGGEYQYTGVYFKELETASIKMADAWEADSSFRIETKTLSEALNLFTEGNEGTHVRMYGTYTK
jgi:hypothetical protein